MWTAALAAESWSLTVIEGLASLELLEHSLDDRDGALKKELNYKNILMKSTTPWTSNKLTPVK